MSLIEQFKLSETLYSGLYWYGWAEHILAVCNHCLFLLLFGTLHHSYECLSLFALGILDSLTLFPVNLLDDVWLFTITPQSATKELSTPDYC